MNAKFVLRMTAPMIAVSLLLLAVGVVAAWYVHNLQKDNSDLLALDVASMLAAEDIEIKMREVRSHLNGYLRSGEMTQLGGLPSLREDTERLLASAKRSARSTREVAFIAEIEEGCHHFFGDVERARRADSPNDAIVRLLSESDMERQIFEPARAFVDYHRRIVERTSRQSQTMADRMGLGLLLLGVCGSAAGLLAGFGIARGVSRSIVQLSIPVHGAAGKLNEVVGPITLSTSAGFEELETALGAMADHIGTVVERLEQREREVLRGEQLAAVGQLAAGIAHELRNPLMAIKILVQAAGDRGDGSLRGRDLAVVEEEIGRLEGSIQALLDFARPPEPAKRASDLRHLIGQTVDLVSARAEQQRVSIVSHTPATPAVVEVDGGQIRQVLLNLLLNALDALPDGGLVQIDIESVPCRGPETEGGAGAALHGRLAAPSNLPTAVEPGPSSFMEPLDGGYVVRVADDGVGLPADLGDRIFEPFISTKETGTGLGLPICRRIIEAHGGKIGAVTGSAGGAEFTIWLPRAEQTANQPVVYPSPHTEPLPLDVLVTHAVPARDR
ncbi:MAG TPA: ATP-binding protein [Pirellulales bacterium]|nr:ATP-binding protein [Pirellulales bacterium]